MDIFDNQNKPDIQEFNESSEYNRIDFQEYSLERNSFEDYRFLSCKFDNISLNDSIFTDCRFEKCSLILTQVENTTFNNVLFQESKLLGVDFGKCNNFLFSLDMQESLLDSIFLFDKNLRNINIVKCIIKNSEFTEVDFTRADFSESRFEETRFTKCNLEKADFRSSQGYQIDPEFNNIKNARFTLPEAQSFLVFLGVVIE